MDADYAKLAVEVLKAMYEHNSKSYSSVGRTDVGPEQLTADQVANDLRVIYQELTNFNS
ncbi:hypothetical protein [Ornithinibacillus sp. FSL M8-0202]|uniref:hypothetical protein n=1 Tax=Ornithinibacillus sp. FSL M8-0202 TaxID=2921616 RepID=UPI0030CD12A8